MKPTMSMPPSPPRSELVGCSGKVRRSTRLAWKVRVGALSATVVLTAGCGITSAPAPTATKPSERVEAAPATSCHDLVARLSPADQVGQLLMVAVPSTGPSSAQRRILTTSRAGSVILLGNSTGGAAAARRVVGTVRGSTVRPAGVRTLLAVDQEGGLVQRLRGPGFDRMPTAEDQARYSNHRLRAAAARWGDQLAAADVDANLAPVADVVPSALRNVNEPIGKLRRGYGASPRIVAMKSRAFTAGMNQSDIATAVKHFPGLGRVRGNTDFARKVVDRTTTRKDAYLAGFAGTVAARVDMVLVSSAFYTKIDPKRRATFSPVVLKTMLRGDLGFQGVVISDDLAAAAMSDVTPAQRALRFLGAGGDLMIIGDPALVAPMTKAVRAKMTESPAFADGVRQSATRVLAMKARRGLAGCT